MHPLKGILSIDVDDNTGLGNIAGVRVEGRPITCAFFEPVGAGGTAPRGTKETLRTWRNFGEGRIAGFRFVPHNWSAFVGKTGSEAAKICSDMIDAVEWSTVAGKRVYERLVDVVEWDIENVLGHHDMPWQMEFLNGKPGTKGIRGANGKPLDRNDPTTLGYRNGRAGVWTMEGHQDINTSAGAQAAASGLLIGPQAYNGPMTEAWDPWYEVLTWCQNANPDRPNGAKVPTDQFLPYYDARKILRPVGIVETVLFATTRLTELYA